MATQVTKTLDTSCGSLWVPKASRINWDDSTVQIGLKVFKDAAAKTADDSCHSDSITVASDGYDGTVSWCVAALKSDPASKLKD